MDKSTSMNRALSHLVTKSSYDDTDMREKIFYGYYVQLSDMSATAEDMYAEFGKELAKRMAEIEGWNDE